MKHLVRFITGLVGLVALSIIGSPTALASTTSLQIAPLQYEAALEGGKVSTGYVDVANPTGTSILIKSSVRGFRQTGIDGQLEFFDDPILTAAIQPGLTEFRLGPREAVRVVFSVDAAKLPKGGIYAAVFFQTAAPQESNSHSYIAEVANVGTLLLLTNGEGSTHQGLVHDLKLKVWQYTPSLSGTFAFTNTDRTAKPVGFKPQFVAQITPWGKKHTLENGFVLPGSQRQFSFNLNGSYLGPLPVTITDTDTGSHTTSWVLACTGNFRWLMPLILAVVLILIFRRWRQRRRQAPPANDEAAE